MSSIAELSIPLPEMLKSGSPPHPMSGTSGRGMLGAFIRGPIPLTWVQRAANLRGRALHVGMALWYLNGFEQTGIVKAKPSVMRELGVDRHAFYRALKALEKDNLVSVRRKRGAAPLVTIRSLPAA